MLVITAVSIFYEQGSAKHSLLSALAKQTAIDKALPEPHGSYPELFDSITEGF